MRCVSILGPSQSGKSTLARQLAALDGAPAASEALDPFHLTTFSFLGEAWCAIDLPGGAEFTVAAEGALMASDAAVLVVPPEPEAAVLCAPWLRAIEAAGTPCLIFINKMDAAQARLRDIIGALQGYSDHTLVLRQIPMREGERVVGAVDLISERAWRFRDGQQAALVALPDGPVAAREAEAREALLEHMSEYDDTLLEELIEDRIPPSDALYAIARRETAGNVLIPAFMGAAERTHGVTRLMKALRHEVPAHDALSERLGGAGAVALHAALRRHMGKIVALRALDGTIAASAPLAGGNIGGLNQIGGGGAGTLSSGAVGLAVKSDHLPVLYPVGDKGALPRPAWAGSREPMLARVLIPASERDEVRLSGALARLAECDAHLVVEPEEETGQPVLRVQGAQHLRRVLAALEADFGLSVETRLPQPPWRETISQRTEIHYRHRKQSGGAGQFADVVMIVEPLPRGEGFRFAEVVKGGAVPRNYIPAVEEGVREAMARGPLGFAVTDIAVTLTDGKHHAVDSSEHAFRTAGRMGLREALAQAGPLLLQGIERVDIQVPSVFSGALVSLVSGLKGQVLGFDGVPDCRGWDLFRATLPAGTRDELLNALAGATQGTAWIEARFDHFEEIYGKEAEAVSKARLAALG
ncbi:MAG: elongation factor G [Pararhodobacter sp.]|nr:elongation factor G [Pararhodobacter sp.]